MSTINPYSPPNPQPEDDPPLVAQLAVEEGMTVEFEQSMEDLEAFAQYHYQQQAKNRRGLLVLLLALLVLLGVGVIAVTLLPRDELQFIGGILGGLAALLLAMLIVLIWLPRLVRYSVRQTYKQGRNLALVGIRRITINPQFVVFASPVVQSAHRWMAVERIEADATAIFIYATSASAYILPRRAFNSDQHFQEFAALAQKYFAEASR